MAARIAIFNGLQIESAGLAPLRKDKPQQRAYFPFDFLTDRFGRFFSCGVSVSSSSTGLGAADFLIGLDQSAVQFLVRPEPRDFALRFTLRRQDWESFP